MTHSNWHSSSQLCVQRETETETETDTERQSGRESQREREMHTLDTVEVNSIIIHF